MEFSPKSAYIYQKFTSELLQFVDIVELKEALFKDDILTAYEFDCIISKNTTRAERCRSLILAIRQKAFPPSVLCDILDKKHPDLAALIEREWNAVESMDEKSFLEMVKEEEKKKSIREVSSELRKFCQIENDMQQELHELKEKVHVLYEKHDELRMYEQAQQELSDMKQRQNTKIENLVHQLSLAKEKLDKIPTCLLLGDCQTGKSSLLQKFFYDTFDQIYIPTVYDEMTVETVINDVEKCLRIIDMGGGDRYSTLRPFIYEKATAVALCIDLTNPTSITQIVQKWLPDLRCYNSRAACMILGLKTDLRKNDSSVERYCQYYGLETSEFETHQRHIIGKLVGKDGVISYVECSAKDYESVSTSLNTLFQIAVNFHDSSDEEIRSRLGNIFKRVTDLVALVKKRFQTSFERIRLAVRDRMGWQPEWV